MNVNKYLILIKGEDSTSDVISCEYNEATEKYNITFRSGRSYSYSRRSIIKLEDPEPMDPALVHITHRGQELFNIQSILCFDSTETEYLRVNFCDGSARTYDCRNLTIDVSCLCEAEARDRLSYLRRIAAINELKTETGTRLLEKQYEMLTFVRDDSAMALYLAPEKYKMRSYPKGTLIFPFGGNASQFRAVERALNNQLSVIQGPPGTGKTQTILNIIANLLIHGKTVQIVSNNNSATQNVLDKLASPKYNMGFLVAALGNADNKKKFCAEQIGTYPALGQWSLPAERQMELLNAIRGRSDEMSDIFSKQERLALARQELDSLHLEMRHFAQFCEESGFPVPSEALRRSTKSETLMRLLQKAQTLSEWERAVSFWFKFKSVFYYGISKWSFYQNRLPVIITLLQSLFYRCRQAELVGEIAQLEDVLSACDAKGKMEELTEWSMTYLRAILFKRYGKSPERRIFDENDLWQNAREVVQEYPVILSTTFSSRSSLKGITYDYIIMDEASQVDVATGALALSCARNAVIVGDLKQLPNVITDDLKRRSEAIFASYDLPEGYSFEKNSFLKSICSILPDAPQTLLREHYRCHPKIIGFCNQKFYNNELVVMTEDRGEPDVLALFKTVAGNHRRGHINQRQIDVILREASPVIRNTRPEDVGVIAPYRDQVKKLACQLGTDEIEIDTVHKFQGREKDTIVLTTVDDVITAFSDDPYLLNVAVSRAKKRLILVASGMEQPSNSNIGDLVDYIEYNRGQVVQSEIYSVFDLLYKQYTDARIAFLKKHPKKSRYVSENLMYGTIADLLNERPNLPLNLICHQPLYQLLRDTSRLDNKLRQYAMNTATHIDLLIYNRISKRPVLAIEVDGFHYHLSGSRQSERDKMKDRILELYHIPLLRFPTNGSGEIEQIARFLDSYETHSRFSPDSNINPIL